MKHSSNLLILLFTSISISFAQVGQKEFYVDTITYYHSIYKSKQNTSTTLSGRYYMAVGSAQPYNISNGSMHPMYVMANDKNSALSSKYYTVSKAGQPLDAEFHSLAESTNGFIICGHAQDQNFSKSYILLASAGALGGITKSILINTGGHDIGKDIIASKNKPGHYYVCSSSVDTNGTKGHVVILETNEALDSIFWLKKIYLPAFCTSSSNTASEPNSMVEDPATGELFLVGNIDYTIPTNYPNTCYNSFIMGISKQGNIDYVNLCKKDTAFVDLQSIKPTSEKDIYLLTGTITDDNNIPFTTTQHRHLLMKIQLDVNGMTTIFQKEYSTVFTKGNKNSNYGYDAAELKDSITNNTNYYTVGSVSFEMTAQSDGNLFITDSLGNLVSQTIYGNSSGDDAISTVIATSGLTNQISMFGYSNGVPYSGWFINADKNGTSGCNEYAGSPVAKNSDIITSPWLPTLDSTFTRDTCVISLSKLKDKDICWTQPLAVMNQPIDASVISVWPNPVLSRLTIDASDEIIQNIRVFDITGKELKTININNHTKAEIDFNDLNIGVYFIQIKTNNIQQVYKIIKQN